MAGLARPFITLAAVGSVLVAGCGEPSAPRSIVETPSFQQCSPETCGGGTDPNPSAAGYYGGSLYSPASCFSANGSGINDADYDGMSDTCEVRLAEMFYPAFALAPASYDCDPRNEPYWAVKYFPSHSNTVRITYLFSYYRDCGASGGIGGAVLSFLGTVFTFNGLFPDYSIGPLPVSSSDQGESHSGDSEFITVDLRWDATSQHWYLAQAFLSAHFGTNADGSALVSTSGFTYPVKYGGFPLLWVSANKHANYRNRAACNAGRGPLGLVHDNCDPNTPTPQRIFFNGNRNIGSAQQNFVNTGTCVRSVNQAQFNPGIECFWKPGAYFQGWVQYPYGPPPTPYYSSLMIKFECYSRTVSGKTMTCSDWGVNRKP